MNKKKILYWVLIGIFSLIFVVSACVVVDYMIKSHQSQNNWEDIQNDFWTTTAPVPTTTDLPTPGTTTSAPTATPTQPTKPTEPGVTETKPTSTEPTTTEPNGTDPLPTAPTTAPTEPTTVPTEPTTVPTEPTTTKPKTILSRFEKLYKANNDVVGYIFIEGTRINYPILHHPEEKDYYLKRDFYGNYDRHGCIYLRESCDMFEPTDVLTIYGHYMSDDTMFADIHEYLDKKFFNSHQTITMWDLYEQHTYQVVCLFKTSGTYGTGFPFHLFDDFANEEEYNEFINGVRDVASTGYTGKTIFDSGIETQYGDQFICLATCEYTINNGRLILVAKRID